MKVNNIQSNDTSFGAKLVIKDNQKILKGSMRTMRHSLDEVRSFSSDELKQIKNGFEQRTKNLKGKMRLEIGYAGFERSPYTKKCNLIRAYDKREYREYSYLSYFPNSNKKCNGEDMSILLLDNMPKSVDEFIDKLVGAFDVLRNRFLLTQKMNSLESNIKSLKKTIKDTSVSEMEKHFEVSGDSKF